MRIVHITLAHQPFDVRIFEKECRTLAAHGYEVHLIAPNCETEIVKTDRVIFHNVRKPAHRVTLLRYMARLGQTYRIAQGLHGNVYHLHDPELVPIGLVFKLIGKHVIYDAHEDAPLEAISINVHRPIRGKLLSLAWRFYLNLGKLVFDGFVAATPHISEKFPASRTALVRNYPDLTRFAAVTQKAFDYEKRPSHVIYVGKIHKMRGIWQMLDAISLFPEHSNLKLVILGPFESEELEKEARLHPGWSRVKYLGNRSWDEVIEQLHLARIGLLIMHPTPENLKSLPNKLFEYMAAGVPIVVSAFPFWRHIVESSACGILVDPLDSCAVAKAIESLLGNPVGAKAMGACGRDAAYRHFDWQTEAQALLALYQRMERS